MVLSAKIRIYPTKSQEKILAYYCDCSHFMWNYMVEKFSNTDIIFGKYGPSSYSAKDLINDTLCNVPQRIALDVIKRYSYAIVEYRRGIKGKPKFHRRNRIKQSFRCASSKMYIKDGTVAVPSRNRGDPNKRDRILLNSEQAKKYNIEFIKNPIFKNVRNKWFLIGEYDYVQDAPYSKNWVGIDWGVKNFITTSDGNIYNYPKRSRAEYERIQRLVRILSTKKVGSKNFDKLSKKIAIAYERQNNIKKDFIEKVGTKIAKNNNVSVENLYGISVKGGRKFIRQNAIISPRYDFFRRLKMKCEKYNSTYVEIDPSNTSRTCSGCGKINESLSLHDRTFVCSCGLVLDRDINAAINIATKGYLLYSSKP